MAFKTLIPDLEVHASTQMGLNNYSSFNWAYENNIKRVVFPREADIEQIKKHPKIFKMTTLTWI